ncbi:ribosomal protein L35AE/L33A [Rhodococcus sp. 27YEA15]|uniref:hypothetical protein n=1 Tax=Rhodococcus sp. 27YEA15 TaxID=3156259 RepID=UPI003C7E90E1
MKLSEARESVGKRVVYIHPETGESEPGIIRGIGERNLVNVQYGPKVWGTHHDNLRIDRSRR